MKTLFFATACLSAFALGGCKTSGMTAQNTVNPVLFGPVPSLGKTRAPPGPPMGVFVTRSMEFASVSSSTTQSGNVRTITTTAEGHATAPTQGDWDALLATSGDPTRRITTRKIRCGGYNFYLLFGMVAESWCEVAGEVHGPPASALPVRKASPADLPLSATPPPSAAVPAPPPPQPSTPAARSTACKSRMDCKPPLTCQRGTCSPPACVADRECGAGKFCSLEGRCEPVKR